MPYVRALLSIMLVLGAGAAAAEPGEPPAAVTIRIHDYAGIDGGQIRQAERQVAEAYARIGVTLDWRALVRPVESAATGAWPSDATDLTIVVLTGSMAARRRVPDNVAGYAPISRQRGGRIAFVLGDRTRRAALDGRVDYWRVLAGVIAHEAAHLLMPQRAHSARGVMRARWNPAEFRDPWTLRFSDAEAAAIRRTVLAMHGALRRVAD